MKKWWTSLDRPRQLMVIALALMTLSQFGNYSMSYGQQISVPIGGGGGGDYVEPNAATGLAMARETTSIPGVSGWKLHPYAWVVLAALLLLFVSGVDLGKWWKAWGYWIAVAGLVVCASFDLEVMPGLGFVAGAIAVGLGVWAARIHGRQLKLGAAIPNPGS